jgi:hypothetical protein
LAANLRHAASFFFFTPPCRSRFAPRDTDDAGDTDDADNTRARIGRHTGRPTLPSARTLQSATAHRFYPKEKSI